MKFKKPLSKNIIKKVIRESLESEYHKDDWDWVSDVNPFTTGNYFNDDDICFNSGSDCQVNINDDNITFVLDYEDWVDFSDINEDDQSYLEPFLTYGPNYDGNGDYYDFDYEEFDYSGYQINDDQKERFQRILDVTSPGTNFSAFADDDMNSVKAVLKYEPLQKLFDDLRVRYLDIIGYQIQKNRWLSSGSHFSSILDKINSSFKLRNGEIVIKISMTEIFKLHEKNIVSLTDILKITSSTLIDENWYDGFYQEWDLSGAEDEIADAFNEFLDKAEEILDEEGVLKPYKDFINLIESLGFKLDRHYTNQYIKEDPNNNIKWIIRNINYGNKTLLLNQYEYKQSLWATPIKQYQISFDQLPTYVSNYKMNF